MDNNRLDQLFNEAKNQAPKASFDKTKERFISSLKNGGGATSSNQLINSNLLKTILIMTSSIVIIGISLFIWNKAPNNEISKKENHNNSNNALIEKVAKIKVGEITPHLKEDIKTINLDHVYLNTVNEFILKKVPLNQSVNEQAKKEEELKEEYKFPVLTTEEKEETAKQKKLMLKKLAKKDKKIYAFIPSGKYNDININAFYMQTTEVSVLEYRTFLFDLLMQDRKEEFLIAKPDQEQWTKIMGAYTQPLTEHYFSHPAYNNYPVNNISREGAVMYCNWLKDELLKSGLLKKNETINNVRIPNLYEWMYAALGGQEKAPYPWGGPYVRNSKGCYLANFKPGKDTSLTCDSWNKLKGVSNNDSMEKFVQTMDDARLPKINENPYSDDGGLFTVNVSSYNPNGYGLYCMSGNIAEMVYDTKTQQLMVKGGSWMSPSYELQINTEGTHVGKTGAMVDVGFRVVISYLEEKQKNFEPVGMIKIKNGLYMDKGEITNFQYKEYLNWLKVSYGETSKQYRSQLPDTTVWSNYLKHNTPYDSLYFSHPAYNNYPVVGISYLQAIAFCEWRTNYLKEYLKNTSNNDYPRSFVFRLPTKEEYESIAGIGYSQKTAKEITNKHKDGPTANFKRNKEDFKGNANNLNADVTAPVLSYWPNAYGIYNLLGNVAEMTNKKGVAKGGSWIHSSQEVTINKDFNYQKPECWLGFRTIYEITEDL